jgi:hypothetical protein
MPLLEAPIFAICGQNIRKVIRKTYGPNDLVSVESQTDETVATVGSQTKMNMREDLKFMDDNFWITEDDSIVPPLALWPQPRPKAKPKVYKRKNKK